MRFAPCAQLFDASIVANKAHAAAWHGWGLLEKRQGNLMKAKDLWLKVGLDGGSANHCTAAVPGA